jgi:hypothetical protein
MSWWALTGTRARLTYLGSAVLVIALVAVSLVVWRSPSTLVNQAIDSVVGKQEAPAALMTERNRLLSALVDVKEQLAQSEQARAQTEEELSSVAAERNAITDDLQRLQAQLDSVGSRQKVVTVTRTLKAAPKPASVPAPLVVPSKAELVNPSSPYFGLMTEQAPHNWATFDAVSEKIGLRPNSVGYFGGWDQEFRPDAVRRAWERHALPVLTWESRPIAAANNAVQDPVYSLPVIIGDPATGVPGSFDDYLHKYARDIVANGLPLGIRLDHEMNGDWYPWSERNNIGNPINGNRPGDFVQMWRHVHDIFAQEGAGDLVIWIWAPNIDNNLSDVLRAPGYLESLYPGDDYVDWVGVSGYLRPPFKQANTKTFDYTFTPTLDQLRAITAKPIFLAEIGASEIGGYKAAWVTSLFQGLADPRNRDIVGFSWFNLAVTSYVKGERATNDWRIDSRGDSLNAFSIGIRASGRFSLLPY